MRLHEVYIVDTDTSSCDFSVILARVNSTVPRGLSANAISAASSSGVKSPRRGGGSVTLSCLRLDRVDGDISTMRHNVLDMVGPSQKPSSFLLFSRFGFVLFRQIINFLFNCVQSCRKLPCRRDAKIDDVRRSFRRPTRMSLTAQFFVAHKHRSSLHDFDRAQTPF